jgi:hypothetical protein
VSRRDDLLEVIRRLEAHGEQHDWLGPDPYEGMNATRLVGPLKGTAMGRRLLLQAVKRSAIDLRPILGIRPTPNAATIAYATSSYAIGGFLDEAARERKLRSAVSRLIELRSPTYEQPCWGYEFATQSRVFFYDRFEPNAITTTWAALALMDAHDVLGDDDLLATIEGVGRFFVDRIPQTGDPPGAYFGYLVGDSSPIHNANLHVASVLARAGARTGHPEWLERAHGALEWSLARQRPDGAWRYGERDNLAWVDNFHTGYMLDALHRLHDAGVTTGIDAAWPAALAYWRAHHFLDDGTPKYYDTGIYPIDGQCVAQAIQSFALYADWDPTCIDDAWRVFHWAVADFRRRDGLFFFQKRRRWTNRVAHMRWVQAPMLMALTHLLAADSRLAASAGSASGGQRAEATDANSARSRPASRSLS